MAVLPQGAEKYVAASQCDRSLHASSGHRRYFGHLRELCATKSLMKRLIPSSPYMPTGTAIALFVVPCGDTVSIIDIQKVTPLVY